MMLSKTFLSTAALAGLQMAVQASLIIEDVAPTFGVTPADVSNLLNSNVADIDIKTWTHPLGVNFADQLDWNDEMKASYLEGVKHRLENDVSIKFSKRQNAAAQNAVKESSRRALTERDNTHRQLFSLSCAKRSKTACLVCKGLCGTAYVSADGVCSAAALTAAAGTGGALSGPAAIGLASCLGLATSAYGACVTTCVRS
ncbi:hypothetical protein EsH8_II_001459 [Colletotrichum jinshuiense]